MNRKITPILLIVLLVMGLSAWLSERPRAGRELAAAGAAHADTVLIINQADILQVRVKRDYWNSFALAKAADGSWRLTEPSSEPADDAAVRKLLSTVESLPVINTINLPADDSERHREYGLWSPTLDITVTTAGGGDQTLAFGVKTADGKGVYCAILGHDRVYVTTPEAFQALSEDMSSYRQGKSSP